MVNEFTPEQAAVFAPMEHERWVREHQMMGWEYSDLYETYTMPDGLDEAEKKKIILARREQMRCHKLTLSGDVSSEEIHEHYLTLPEEEQNKDWKPFNSMLKLLKRFDGLRIYSLS